MAKKSKKHNDKAAKRMSAREFDKELDKLQIELCKLQDWVVQEGLRVVVVFEGHAKLGVAETTVAQRPGCTVTSLKTGNTTCLH